MLPHPPGSSTYASTASRGVIVQGNCGWLHYEVSTGRVELLVSADPATLPVYIILPPLGDTASPALHDASTVTAVANNVSSAKFLPGHALIDGMCQSSSYDETLSGYIPSSIPKGESLRIGIEGLFSPFEVMYQDYLVWLRVQGRVMQNSPINSTPPNLLRSRVYFIASDQLFAYTVKPAGIR